METFNYTPVQPVGMPEIPGLTIEEIDDRKLGIVRVMNRSIFNEERVINSFEREDLLMLLARIDGEPAGFKIGYRENRFTFYSAKGGIVPIHRRKGIAVALMVDMMERVTVKGYSRFAFDTFPNLHPGMTTLALKQGFRLVKADYNSVYREYRLRFEARLTQSST